MAHMHYKSTGKVHSFRGLLADGGQNKIRIQGPVGAIAWRITKFQIVQATPFATAAALICKIYRESQSSIVATIDFREDELLGVATYYLVPGAQDMSLAETIIFDNALFSRNIYISSTELEGSESCNYYIELEEVKVSAAGMAQLAVAAARRTID